MNTFYRFPKKTVFDRIVPKEKIYQTASVDQKRKRFFIDQIERIKWTYKLAPETINITASETVKEIQVFTLTLKTSILSDLVLKTIDRAVPSPILFILEYDSKIRYRAAYKRPSEANKKKSVLSDYFGHEIFESYSDAAASSLPTALNLARLYDAFLKNLIPLQVRLGESMAQMVMRYEEIEKLQKKQHRLAAKIHSTKQFNRRVDVNQELKTVQEQIKVLKK